MSQVVNFKFQKGERLRHKALVQVLFDKGEGIYEYPLRLMWRLATEKEIEGSFRAGLPDKLDHLQMMVTVPKKKRRRAVDRVLMRRRIKEAYRLNRIPLKTMLEDKKVYLQLGLVYISSENEAYSKIEKRMRKILSRLSSEVEKRLLCIQEGNEQIS